MHSALITIIPDEYIPHADPEYSDTVYHDHS